MAHRKIDVFEQVLAQHGYPVTQSGNVGDIGRLPIRPQLARGAIVRVETAFWTEMRGQGRTAVPNRWLIGEGASGLPRRGLVLDVSVELPDPAIALVTFVRPTKDPLLGWGHPRECINYWVPQRHLTPIGWARGRELDCRVKSNQWNASYRAASGGPEGILEGARKISDVDMNRIGRALWGDRSGPPFARQPSRDATTPMRKWEAEAARITQRLESLLIDAEERGLLEDRLVKLDHLMEIYSSLGRGR